MGFFFDDDVGSNCCLWQTYSLRGQRPAFGLGALPQVVLFKACSLLSKNAADVVTGITKPKKTNTVIFRGNYELCTIACPETPRLKALHITARGTTPRAINDHHTLRL